MGPVLNVANVVHAQHNENGDDPSGKSKNSSITLSILIINQWALISNFK